MKIKKIIKKLKQDKYIFLLILFSTALLASTIRYGLRTYKIPEWDEQHYMRMATEFYRLVKYNLSFNTPYEMTQIVPFRQLGYPLMILPFLLLFGLSQAYFWGIFTNGLLYIATIFGIYFLARNFLSNNASFIASVLFAFYGWTLLHLHLTFSETASSAFAIWTLIFLVKSNLFQNRKYSLLFGLFLGLGILTRWTILVYISGPLLYIFYQQIKKHILNRKILLNLVISSVVAFLISFYQYLQNYHWMFNYFADVSVGSKLWLELKDQSNPLSLYSQTFYLNTFAQLGFFFFILIAFGFILAFRKKSTMKLILFTALSGYIFSVLAPIKGERYVVPIFPYLAILSASVFDYIKNTNFKKLLIVFTIILSGLSFLGSAWGKGPMRQSLVSLPIELPFGQLKKIYLTTYSRPPYIYKISGKEILDFIVQDSKNSGIEDPQILSMFYYRPLDEPLMTYNLYNQEKSLQINNFLGTIINNPENETAYISKVIGDSDYILTKSGKRIDNYFLKENYVTLKALIILFDNYFDVSRYYEEKTKIWIYQDSSEVGIWKKKKEIPDQELEKMRLKLVEILNTNKYEN